MEDPGLADVGEGLALTVDGRRGRVDPQERSVVDAARRPWQTEPVAEACIAMPIKKHDCLLCEMVLLTWSRSRAAFGVGGGEWDYLGVNGPEAIICR